jgi:hypothetical protein
MKIKPTGVSADGTRHYEISGIPGAPKEIPGIRKRPTPQWSMSGCGKPFIPPRPPKVGEAITVDTDAGRIRMRVTKVRDDKAMIGAVEILDTPSGTALDIHGVRHKDSVVVRDMDFVQIVHAWE